MGKVRDSVKKVVKVRGVGSEGKENSRVLESSKFRKALRLELELALEKRNILPKYQDVSEVVAVGSLNSKHHDKNADLVREGFNATVIFGQYECGRGVLVDPAGHVLTCAHCLGNKPKIGTKKILVVSNGDILLSVCTRLDAVADLALLQVVGSYDHLSERIVPTHSTGSSGTRTFPSVKIAPSVTIKEKLICFGQPGCDDLESSENRKTGYDVLVKSTGMYERCLPGDIGHFQHNCWTYWGHSGAALFDTRGQVVGLHSSWDDECGTRHGVHLLAIRKFLELND